MICGGAGDRLICKPVSITSYLAPGKGPSPKYQLVLSYDADRSPIRRLDGHKSSRGESRVGREPKARQGKSEGGSEIQTDFPLPAI